MKLRWPALLVPGVLFSALGVLGLALRGLEPLSMGNAAVGFLLSVAAALQAQEDRKR